MTTLRRKASAKRSTKVAEPECVLRNAASLVVATRYKAFSGCYVLDLFDSAGVRLARLGYTDQDYDLSIERGARFFLEYRHGFSELGFFDSTSGNRAVTIEHIGREPAAV